MDLLFVVTAQTFGQAAQGVFEVAVVVEVLDQKAQRGAVHLAQAQAAAAKREAQGDRFAKTIAPHVCGDDAAYALDRDALDELDRSTVRLRGVA